MTEYERDPAEEHPLGFDSIEEADAEIGWRLAGSPDPRRRRPPSTSMSARESLDQQMRQVLAALETCSHVPAAAWGPTGRSRSSDEPQGGSRPPGDYGHTVYAVAYGEPFHTFTAWCKHHLSAQTDDERASILDRARTELRHLRGHGERLRVAGETQAQIVARMLQETKGMTPEQVATTRFAMSPTITRRHRRNAGLDPEFGKPLPESIGRVRGIHGGFVSHADADARRARVLQLRADGMPIARIALLLGVHRNTVHNDLGKRAA